MPFSRPRYAKASDCDPSLCPLGPRNPELSYISFRFPAALHLRLFPV